MTLTFIDYYALDKCKNLEYSYGEICVQCNKCERFNNSDDKDMEAKLDEIFNEVFDKEEI